MLCYIKKSTRSHRLAARIEAFHAFERSSILLGTIYLFVYCGSVAELVYAGDLKSPALKSLWVRVPPEPFILLDYTLNIFEEVRNSVISLDDLFEKSNKLFKDNGLDFHMVRSSYDENKPTSIYFSHELSNSHCAPFGKSTNWGGRDGPIRGYPGLRFYIKVKFDNGYDKHKDTKEEGSSYRSYNSKVKKLLNENNAEKQSQRRVTFDRNIYGNIISLLGFNKGTGGGGGGYLSYDCQIFFEDFKLLNEAYLEFANILPYVKNDMSIIKNIISEYRKREKILCTTNIPTYIATINLQEHIDKLKKEQTPIGTPYASFMFKMDEKYYELTKAVIDCRKKAILKDRNYIKNQFKNMFLKSEDYIRFYNLARQICYSGNEDYFIDYSEPVNLAKIVLGV